MRNLELLIFDCDGVLLDSERLSCECAVEALRSVGMNTDLDTVYSRFVGTSRHDIAKQVTEDGYAVPADFADQLERSVVEAFESRLRAIPGVQQALSRLEPKKCVASGSPVYYIQRGLRLTGLEGFFGANLFSASMVTHGKPAPDLFLHAARQMGVSPDQCLVIEDSITGVRAAKAARMPVFCFLGGSHIDLKKRPLDFSQARPDLIFDRMDQLPELVESFCQSAHSSRIIID